MVARISLTARAAKALLFLGAPILLWLDWNILYVHVIMMFFVHGVDNMIKWFRMCIIINIYIYYKLRYNIHIRNHMIIFDPSHVNHACVPVCPLPVANRGCIVVIMYHNRWRGVRWTDECGSQDRNKCFRLCIVWPHFRIDTSQVNIEQYRLSY